MVPFDWIGIRSIRPRYIRHELVEVAQRAVGPIHRRQSSRALLQLRSRRQSRLPQGDVGTCSGSTCFSHPFEIGTWSATKVFRRQSHNPNPSTKNRRQQFLRFKMLAKASTRKKRLLLWWHVEIEVETLPAMDTDGYRNKCDEPRTDQRTGHKQ